MTRAGDFIPTDAGFIWIRNWLLCLDDARTKIEAWQSRDNRAYPRAIRS